MAGAAPPRSVDDNRVADGDGVHVLPHGFDDASALVAQGERQLVGEGFGVPVHDCEVGVADSRGGDAQQDLAGAGSGHVNVDDAGRLADLTVLDGMHGVPPLRAVRLGIAIPLGRLPAGGGKERAESQREGGRKAAVFETLSLPGAGVRPTGTGGPCMPLLWGRVTPLRSVLRSCAAPRPCPVCGRPRSGLPGPAREWPLPGRTRRRLRGSP